MPELERKKADKPVFKADVVANMDRPFEVVDKSERRTPLQRLNSRHCDHDRAFKTDAYPTSGPTFVCVDCDKKSSYPRDLE